MAFQIASKRDQALMVIVFIALSVVSFFLGIWDGASGGYVIIDGERVPKGDPRFASAVAEFKLLMLILGFVWLAAAGGVFWFVRRKR